MPKSFVDKIFREMSTETEMDGKVKKFVTEIKDFCGRGLVATDMEAIFHSAVKRAHLAYNYQIKRMKKFNKFRETMGKKWLTKTLRLHVLNLLKSKTFTENKSTELFDMFEHSEVSDSQFTNLCNLMIIYFL